MDDIDLERLKEIQIEMLELLEEAEHLVRASGNRMVYDRARSYWLAHIKMALMKESEYLGHSMVTMEDTISEIEGNGEKDIKDKDRDEDIELD